MKPTENPHLPVSQSPDKVPPTVEVESDSSGQRGFGQAWSVLSLLFAGMIVWGAAGWGLDRLLDTKFLTPTGILLGFAGSIYLIIMKYGRPGDHASGSPKADVPPRNTDDTKVKG